MSDKKNIKQFLRGILDKYSDNTLKAKDVVPDFISQKIGQSFSNAKLPAGYETAIDPGKFILSGLNTLSGNKDERLWTKDMNPELQPGQMGYGNKYADISEFDIRDFLNRKGFGMSDNMSGRGKSLKELDISQKGDNNYVLGRNSKVGDTFYKKFDPEADKWAKEQIGLNSTGEPIRAIGNKHSKFEGKKWPIMANVGNNDVSFGGEGFDDNGYYNIVKMSDKWDYALHPDESVINQGSNRAVFGENANITDNNDDKTSMINLGRSLLDQFMDPATLTAEKKVYIPGVKKKALKPGNPKIMNVPDPNL